MARKTPRKERQKPVKVQFVPRPDKSTNGHVDLIDPYAYLDELVASHRNELAEAEFMIFWMLDVKADKDGRLVLGKCKKASDCDREIAVAASNGRKTQVDFVIFLNGKVWKEALNQQQRAALMHHELCHAAVSLDKNDEPIKDERGRTCYRIRKHDIEEFKEVVTVHGIYKADLHSFAMECSRKVGSPLFEPETAVA